MAEAFEEADTLILKQQYEYAIFLLTGCIKEDYRKHAALIRRATCYKDMHRYREAIDDFQMAINIDRSLPSAYIKQSECYVAIGDLQNAINSLTFLLSIEDQKINVKQKLEDLELLRKYDKKAVELYHQKNYEEIIDIMDKCLKRAKTCIKFKLLKAECLVYLGKHNEALSTINEVLFTNKDDLEAVCIRALNLMHQQKYNLGMAELREILSISPKAKELFRTYKKIIEKLKLADKELEKNNLIQAEALYNEVLQLDFKNKSKNKDVSLKLSQIYLRKKEYQKCIDLTSKILEMDNENIKALEFRAKSNYELEDYDFAIEDYNAVLKINNTLELQKNLQLAQQKAKTFNDNYVILGLPENTTAAEIKKAYKNLARIFHPDKGTACSSYETYKLNVKFAKLNQAYNHLLNIHTE